MNDHIERDCIHFQDVPDHPLHSGCLLTAYVFSGDLPVNGCKHFELKPEILNARIKSLEQEIEHKAACDSKLAEILFNPSVEYALRHWADRVRAHSGYDPGKDYDDLADRIKKLAEVEADK
jgi:hypothetical protein